MQGIPLRTYSAVLTALIFTLPASALGQSHYFQGKTIRVIQGRNPGGSGDLRVKAMIPLLQKYLPGHPTIVQEYMPGGGGRKAGNYIFSSAKPDGLTLGNSGGGMVAAAVLGGKGVQYDLDKLIFLGSPYSSTHYFFLSRSEVGLTTLAKLRAAKGVRIGAQSVGHTIYNVGRIFAWLLNLKEPKFVTGYSTPERDAAFMAGELDAFGTADDHLLRNPEWIEHKKVNLHVVMEVPRGLKYPHFTHLPEIESLAATERERKVLAMFRNLRLTGSPFYAPPGTAPEIIHILKEAMTKTYNDPEFRKEYKKLVSDDPTPLFPDANQQAIRELPRDAETVALFNHLAGPEPLPQR